jgi:NADP-dependent 3-hydroxy acid dehydrogenase YdfG
MDLFGSDGKTAFLTWAPSGIGQRIAIGMAEPGARMARVEQ